MQNDARLKISGAILIGCLLMGGWLIISEIYYVEAQSVERIEFTIEKNESLGALAKKLEAGRIIRYTWLFKRYLTLRGMDKELQAGEYAVEAPLTLARVAAALEAPIKKHEREITIIPGWDLRDLAAYLERVGVAKEKEVYALLGEPATQPTLGRMGELEVLSAVKITKDKPPGVSYEGYLAPQTFRVFNDATVADALVKFIRERDKQFTARMYEDVRAAGRTTHAVLTVASLVEREVKTKDDRARVADILWRRYDKHWALQADASVHYAVGRKGELFTTREERDSKNPWNTYQYPGLPPGPICNPSLESIRAAIYPEHNQFWYFLTTLVGEVKYAQTLEEHSRNVARYLR